MTGMNRWQLDARNYFPIDAHETQQVVVVTSWLKGLLEMRMNWIAVLLGMIILLNPRLPWCLGYFTYPQYSPISKNGFCLLSLAKLFKALAAGLTVRPQHHKNSQLNDHLSDWTVWVDKRLKGGLRDSSWTNILHAAIMTGSCLRRQNVPVRQLGTSLRRAHLCARICRIQDIQILATEPWSSVYFLIDGNDSINESLQSWIPSLNFKYNEKMRKMFFA